MDKGYEDIREIIRNSGDKDLKKGESGCTRCPAIGKGLILDDGYVCLPTGWIRLSIGDMTTMFLCEKCEADFYKWFFAVNTRITEE